MMFLEQFLIGNLWNIGLICVMLGLKLLLHNRLSLRFQYYSWYVLLGSLLLSFLPSGLLAEFQSVGSVGQQAFAISNATSNTADVGTAGTEWLQDTTELIVGSKNSHFAFSFMMIWLVGVLALVVVYGCGSYRLHSIKQSTTEPSSRIRKRFNECKHRLGLSQDVDLRQSSFISAPVSFGWRKPLVVLPKGIDGLLESELDHVLFHELTHIKHGDIITNYLFCGVQALYWCNPLVRVAIRQMRRDREAYCDWAVLNELTDEAERISYGQTILNFAAGSNPRFYTANGFCQSKEQLKYRLEQVVGFQRETKWKRLLGRCFAGMLALAAIGQIPILAYCTEYSEEYYRPADALTMVEADWGSFFGNSDGCAVVYNLNADQYTVYNEPEVTRRVPPCSTYKIYSALNALEQGLITPESNTVSWDGTVYSFEAWNQDQTLKSAMQGSVNWYFQSLDREAGTDFFAEIGYGDGNLGDDPDSYWNGSGIKISALEQVELLIKLYRNDFGFSDANIEAVIEAIELNDAGLFGKTGTGRHADINIAGWFVGFVETRSNTYFIAVYLNSDEGADGALAYETAWKILENINIIE